MSENNKKDNLDILKKYSRKNRKYGSDYSMYKEKNRNKSTSKNICDTHIDGA